MAKGDKYHGITRYLEQCGKDEITLSFEQIKKANDGYLPKSAYTYSAWWANDPKTHTHSYGWLNAGYKTVQVDMKAQTVKFEKE